MVDFRRSTPGSVAASGGDDGRTSAWAARRQYQYTRRVPDVLPGSGGGGAATPSTSHGGGGSGGAPRTLTSGVIVGAPDQAAPRQGGKRKKGCGGRKVWALRAKAALAAQSAVLKDQGDAISSDPPPAIATYEPLLDRRRSKAAAEGPVRHVRTRGGRWRLRCTWGRSSGRIGRGPASGAVSQAPDLPSLQANSGPGCMQASSLRTLGGEDDAGVGRSHDGLLRWPKPTSAPTLAALAGVGRSGRGPGPGAGAWLGPNSTLGAGKFHPSFEPSFPTAGAQ